MTTVTPDRRQQARSDGPVVPVIGAPARRILLDIAREALRVATGQTTMLEPSVAIKRDRIQVHSVTWKPLDQGLVLLTIKYFNEDTYLR